MKTYYLLFILLSTSVLATDSFAQTHNDNLKEAEKQRAIDNERNKERDRQNLENNRPVEKENSSTTTTNSNQSYIDMAKSIIGYKEPELTEAEKAAKERYIKEWNEKKRLENVRMTPEEIYAMNVSIATRNREKANEKLILTPFIDQLVAVGYSSDDAERILSRYKSDLLASTFYSKSRDKEFEQEIIVFLKVKDNSKKISFETLSQDAVNLVSARSYTSSLDYLTLLEKQFSEKKADVDMLRKEVFKSYFWHEASYGDMSNTAKKKLIEDYFVFEEANPTFYNELHNFLKGKLGTSPYKIVKFHYKDKLDCTICSYSGKEKKEFKDAIEKYKSREDAVIKNTFIGYYREDSTKGKISYFNSDKVEITIEEFMIHQVELNYKDDFRFEPNMTLDLIQKLATIKKVEPVGFITDFLRIEPKDKFELLLKMAENNDYQAMRSAYQQEKDERYKDINASYHLKDKWFDYFASRAVKGNVEALNMLYQSYVDYNDGKYNNKNTAHPIHFEETFISCEVKATENEVLNFAEILGVEYYKSYSHNKKYPHFYPTKLLMVGVNAIERLAKKGNSKAVELQKKWNKIKADEEVKIEAKKNDCTSILNTTEKEKGGCGTENYSNGNKYQGEFKKGLYNGKGKYTWYDGSIYEGDYLDGKRHGKGAFKWVSGNMYLGDFENNLLQGKGKFTYADGSFYVGDFVKDKYEGKGKLTYTDGSFYEGDFTKDERTGKGIFSYANGETFEGDFVKGSLNGKGKHSKKSGYYSIGVYKDGVVNEIHYFNPSKVEISKEEFDANN